jgi:hypothetical protein
MTLPVVVPPARVARRARRLPMLNVVMALASLGPLDSSGRFTVADAFCLGRVHATPCQHVPQDRAKGGKANQAVHENLAEDGKQHLYRTFYSPLRLPEIEAPAIACGDSKSGESQG